MGFVAAERWGRDWRDLMRLAQGDSLASALDASECVMVVPESGRGKALMLAKVPGIRRD